MFVGHLRGPNVADDENDNVAMRRHAPALRELTTLPGKPTVLCCAIRRRTPRATT